MLAALVVVSLIIVVTGAVSALRAGLVLQKHLAAISDHKVLRDIEKAGATADRLQRTITRIADRAADLRSAIESLAEAVRSVPVREIVTEVTQVRTAITQMQALLR